MKKLIATDPKYERIGKDIIEVLNTGNDMFNPFFIYGDFKFVIKGKPNSTEPGYIVVLKCVQPRHHNTALRIQFQQRVRGKVISIVRTYAKRQGIPFNSSDRGMTFEPGIHVRTDRPTRTIQVSVKPW